MKIPRFRRSIFDTRSGFLGRWPTVWNSLPDSMRDPAVESERVSARLNENASLKLTS